MKRKFFALFIVLSLMVTITGCGDDIIVDVITNDDTYSYDTGSSGQDENISSDSSEIPKIEVEAATEEVPDTNPAGLKTIPIDNVKVGVLYIGSASDTSGYTYAHELGIQGMAANLGMSDSQIIRKELIDDGDDVAIRKALDECVDEGCNIIFTTSWGYMQATSDYAEKYPDIYFAHGTGYMSNGKNFTNYFGRIYQARYLSGIAAGLKTKSNLIGYVSAQGSDNSECTGGIDAFAMGIHDVNPDAKVLVAVTNSWFSPDDEKAASDALIAKGCDVLAQHVDTTAPQTTSEENGTWSIGYNSDMSKETPGATLTSVIWNWSAFYTSFVESVVKGTYDASNYYGGMTESLIALTPLSTLCEAGTQDKINEMQQKILSGDFGVFDGVIETNTGNTVGEEGKTLDDATITGGINWYYKNVEVINWK